MARYKYDIEPNLFVEEMYKKNYTTKKGNTGLGLWKIHDILKKDTSLDLFTTKDEKMFKQKLEIYGITPNVLMASYILKEKPQNLHLYI